MFSSLLQKAGFKPGLALYSTIPKALMAAAMVGGASSLLAAGSANALPPPTTCYFGGYAGPAGSVACSATTGDPGNVLSIGDKTVTFTSLPSAVTGGAGSITFLNSVADFFALKTSFLDAAFILPGVSTLSYDVEIISGLQTFKGVQLSVDAFGDTKIEKQETSTPTGFNTLTSLNSTSPIPSTSLFEPVNLPGLTKLKVLDTYTLTTGSVSSFTNTFQQTPINPVPGPLPLMGAGMAFGFSRKLRSRIKASANKA